MSKAKKIVADTSFYLCFLDDIKRPAYLMQVVAKFDCIVTKLIHDELSKSHNFNKHLQKSRKIIILDFNFGEIVKPFLGKPEISKGEHEIIGLAYFLYQIQIPFIFILDDDGARRFVTRNFNYLNKIMKGTVGFVAMCYHTFRIFTKDEALQILNDIEHSKFRVAKHLLYKAKEEIEEY